MGALSEFLLCQGVRCFCTLAFTLLPSSVGFWYLPCGRFFGKSVNVAVSGTVRNVPCCGQILAYGPFLCRGRPTRTMLQMGDVTVVKRAIALITGMAHVHDVAASRRRMNAGAHTVRLRGVVRGGITGTNLERHQSGPQDVQFPETDRG